VFLQQPRAGGLAVVEGRDVAVAFPGVVVGIDHDLARQRLHWDIREALERDGDDGEIACRCRFGGRRGPGARSQFRDEVRQRFRSPGIADHDAVAQLHRLSGDLASDVSCTNDSNCCHGVRNPVPAG
jgi:hypothetical protein